MKSENQVEGKLSLVRTLLRHFQQKGSQDEMKDMIAKGVVSIICTWAKDLKSEV